MATDNIQNTSQPIQANHLRCCVSILGGNLPFLMFLHAACLPDFYPPVMTPIYMLLSQMIQLTRRRGSSLKCFKFDIKQFRTRSFLFDTIDSLVSISVLKLPPQGRLLGPSGGKIKQELYIRQLRNPLELTTL